MSLVYTVYTALSLHCLAMENLSAAEPRPLQEAEVLAWDLQYVRLGSGNRSNRI